MIERLARAFSIKKTEFALVQAFFLFFTGIGMFYTVGATVGDTLFLANLSQHEVPKVLPWVYVGIAVASFIATILYDALQHRVSRLAAIVGMQVILAGTVLAFRFAIDLNREALYLFLVVWMEVSALLSITLFFSFAGDYFTSGDARRFYGFIAGGMALGTVISGQLIGVAVQAFGTRNLLYACAGLLLFNALISFLIYRFGTPVPKVFEGRETAVREVSVREILGRPFVQVVGLVIALTIIVSIAVDYQMKWVASTLKEAELAEFFGTFWGWVGTAQILFQFLVVPRLLRRLGIINCLIILPITVGAASVLVLGGSAVGYLGLSLLTFSAGANFLRLVLSETLDLPSRELLFLPLPTSVRVRVQPFMNGAMASMARALGGFLLLLLFYIEADTRMLSLVVLSCCLVLVFALYRLRLRYRDTLAGALRSQEVVASDLYEAVKSPAVDPVVEELLRSKDPNVVKFTLGLVQNREIGALAPVLEDLAGSKDSSIIVEVLKCLGTDAKPEFLPIIRRALGDQDAKVREAAVLALCQARGQDALGEVSSMIGSDSQAIRTAAIASIARHCGPEGKVQVLEQIRGRVESADPKSRANAATLIGNIGKPDYTDFLRRLMADKDLQVRIEAVRSAALTGDTALVPDLLAAADRDDLKQAAIAALTGMPRDAVGALIERAGSRSGSIDDRSTFLKIVAGIGGPRAAAFLWAQTTDGEEDLLLRVAAARALRSLRIQQGLYNLRLRRFNAHLNRIYATLALLNRAVEELGESDKFATAAYRDHARLQIELMLSLFALRYHPQQLGRIQFSLFSEVPTTRARAIELLDDILPRRIAPRVISLIKPLLESPPTEGKGLSSRTQARLLDSEPWLRAVTAYHMARGDRRDPAAAGVGLTAFEQELYSRLDQVSLLKGVPLFGDLTANYLKEKTDLVRPVTLPGGRALFEQDADGDAVYVVVKGEASVRVNGYEVARLGPFECAGDMAVLEDRERSAQVIAATDARFLRIEAAPFMQLLSGQSAMAKALMRILDRRIRSTQAVRRDQGLPEEPVESAEHVSRLSIMSMATPDLYKIIPVISFLCQVDLFKALPIQTLTRLAGIVHERRYVQGDVLFEQGDAGDCVYLVKSGAVDIIADGRKVAQLGSRTCLGEMSLIGGLSRSATARVAEDTALLRLWADDFNQLIATESEVALALLRTLSGRLREISRLDRR